MPDGALGSEIHIGLVHGMEKSDPHNSTHEVLKSFGFKFIHNMAKEWLGDLFWACTYSVPLLSKVLSHWVSFNHTI